MTIHHKIANNLNTIKSIVAEETKADEQAIKVLDSLTEVMFTLITAIDSIATSLEKIANSVEKKNDV